MMVIKPFFASSKSLFFNSLFTTILFMGESLMSNSSEMTLSI